jgi:hypothetical protein
LTEKSKLAMNPVGSPNKADLQQDQGLGETERAGAADFLQSSQPIAGRPGEQHKGGDQADHDKHPVLDLEAQNGEMLDQKLHLSRPFLSRISGLAAEIYYFCISKGVQTPGIFQIPTGIDAQKCDLEPASMDNPFRKSSRACFPATSAA